VCEHKTTFETAFKDLTKTLNYVKKEKIEDLSVVLAYLIAL
jgi:hypothetical protein